MEEEEKVSSGPGYFQTSFGFKCNRKSDNRPNKAWEKLPVISNGGEYCPSTGEPIYLFNTCTFDNFPQAFLVHYSPNIHHVSTVFESDDPIVGKVCNVGQFLLSHDIDTVYYHTLGSRKGRHLTFFQIFDI